MAQAKKEEKKVTNQKPKSTKTTTKKGTTPKTEATKKTATTKRVATKKATPTKKESKTTGTKKIGTSKTTKTTKKNSVKQETKKVSPKKIETVTETKLTKPIILEEVEINDEYTNEKTKTINIKEIKEQETLDDSKEDNKAIIFLIGLMIIIFIIGLLYIYDYSKKENQNNNDNKPTVINDEKLNLDEAKSVNNVENNSKKDSKTNYENIKEISIKEYQEKLNNNEKMIVLIASKYCGSCSSFEPVFNKSLSLVKLKAYKIDVATLTTEEKNLFNSLFNITGTPTTFIIENGNQKASIIGYRSQEATTSWLNENY